METKELVEKIKRNIECYILPYNLGDMGETEKLILDVLGRLEKTELILEERKIMKIPKRIKVIKSFMCDKFRKPLKINEGEIGEYFEHTDVYLFEARDGYVPYIDRGVAIRNNLHFEKLSDEQN